jgi:hypothetical protein
MNDTKPIAIIAVVLIAVIGGGTWWMMRGGGARSTNATPKVVNGTEAPIDSKGSAPVDLPPLDQMDAFLRPLLQALTARPELVKWLATDDLVGQLAGAIDRASEGNSPARDLKVIAPTSPFVAAGRGTHRTIDPKSYTRYDSLTATITSMDASKVAQIYKTIRPRLNEAYQKLGNPNGDVDRAARSALDILLKTPVVKDPIAVVEAGGSGWAFADPKLEALESSQKQLLRMGPDNVDKLLAWLRAVQTALQ